MKTCHFCSTELIKLIDDGTLWCVPCSTYSKCGVIYHMNGDDINYISISYLEIIRTNIDPRYLGPADDFEFQYYVDELFYKAKIYLDKNTTAIYKIKVNAKDFFNTSKVPMFTLSSTNSVTPDNMKSFISKLNLYTTFS